MDTELNMDDPLEKLIAAKTNDELQDILLYIKDYSAAEVKLAISELQKRGKYFNELQLDYLKNVIQRKLIDENPNTPSYYSPKTIFTFSILCSVLYGSILFALNLKERRDKWVSIGFGITFMVFEITMSTIFNVDAFIILLVNAIGGGILAQYFWNRYIGKDIPYKKKSILISTLIAIALLIIFVLFIIFNEGMHNAFMANYETVY
jgi:hypothetical protein